MRSFIPNAPLARSDVRMPPRLTKSLTGLSRDKGSLPLRNSEKMQTAPVTSAIIDDFDELPPGEDEMSEVQVVMERRYHVSGHASGEDVQQAIDEIYPNILVPVHTVQSRTDR